MNRVKRPYAFRYSLEPWGKPPSAESVQVREGIRVSENRYGYCDELFMASIVKQGEEVDVLVLSTEGRPENKPSEQMLLLIRAQIDQLLAAL